MIRRGFWLAAGAVTGIYGYRRVSAAGRRLSASLAPGSTSRGELNRLAVRRTRRGAVALARETYRFTRDVREGMELYRLTHAAPAVLAGRDGPPTLSTDYNHEPEDGH